MVYLGDQLGLYRALRGAGPLTSAELADRSGLHERWGREWLHGQASAGLLYALSVLDCLSCGTSQDNGAALGTLGFPAPVAREMTATAGFSHFTVRDFGNPLNSFYEVRPEGAPPLTPTHT